MSADSDNYLKFSQKGPHSHSRRSQLQYVVQRAYYQGQQGFPRMPKGHSFACEAKSGFEETRTAKGLSMDDEAHKSFIDHL